MWNSAVQTTALMSWHQPLFGSAESGDVIPRRLTPIRWAAPMTIGELASLGEMIGAVATAATLLYLSIQIRSNTLASRRQALDDTIERIVRWQARLADSPDLIHAWISGARSFHDLSTDDQLRFTALLIEILAGIEATLEAAKFGGVKSETVGAVRSMIWQLSRNKGVREHWDTSGRNTFAADFVREVETIFEDARGADPRDPGPLPFHIPGA